MMSAFPTKILLATDGSEEATLAAETAAELANKLDSELHVLYVGLLAYQPCSYQEEYVGNYVEEQKDLDKIAQDMLDEQVRKIEASGGSVAQAHLDTGKPDVAITDLAERLEAGLVMMGSRGLGGIRRTLMRSVSDSVIRHAHCAVLIVRE